MKENGNVELSWFFVATNEQYRLAGKARLIGEEVEDDCLLHVRQSAWNKLRISGKDTFFDVNHEPGSKDFEGGGLSNSMKHEELENYVDTAYHLPPQTFLLLLVTPSKVDYVNLLENKRFRHELQEESGEWSVTRINV